MRSRNLLFFLVVLLTWAGCQSPRREVKPAFYHWQSTFSLAPSEQECLEKTGTQRLYLRFFDVDWSEERGKVVPISILEMKEKVPAGTEIVPTIYMTNRTLLKTPAGDLDTLQKRISALLFSLVDRFEMANPTEVQVDCDWSSRTREKYFLLLEGLKKDLQSRGMKLSVTIRLHQLKYRRQTGIPPADRGMLMFYNMGHLDDPKEENSILNIREGKSYLSDFQPYPLPLDAALPIFAWGVVTRQGKTVFLLNGLRAAEAEQEEGMEKIAPNRFKVVESRYFRGEYLYRGDLIRTEAVTDSLLLEAADVLANTFQVNDSQWKEDTLHVALYHLDSLTISHYDLETFSSVWNAFR